jgi:hypothetical protein
MNEIFARVRGGPTGGLGDDDGGDGDDVFGAIAQLIVDLQKSRTADAQLIVDLQARIAKLEARDAPQATPAALEFSRDADGRIVAAKLT